MRAQPSQEARSKTQWSLGSREGLTSSPRREESYEGVLGSHDGLSPSQEARRKTQQSWRAGKDSCRVLDQGRAVRESWRAIMGSVRVKKQRVRLSRAWGAGKDSCRVPSQGGATGRE